MFPIYEVIFFIFAALLIAAAVMVIVSRNPVHAVVFLVLAFFASAILWMMMQAEFLALVLIFVYVGAVMTLFLFIVMMLNINLSKIQEKFIRFLPFGLIAMFLLIATMIVVVSPRHFGITTVSFPRVSSNFSNVKAMGSLLYIDYLYPLQIAAVILLVAIIAAITLAFHGRKPNTKTQRIPEQLEVKKSDRLRLVKMEIEKT
ncbi:NADH:ubiquinone oxidoreductase subunit J [Coxiella-like endosymbiont of Rhipicephalus sanguineus]|uniref:NADH-quinone oxidoreductase subunit J n=1 Tax=Coxiella-like endosymbiont of Rhipicephalus sanguineus TaxID=1955402 RepID=UPI00203C1595|nr:NADH-quinone oxidoreductase subunit J [Coxiella-like endosymbiont of Rhipicephalus sanguineus]MBT8506373.1 NADH:ubiquinone oxidoreductase subunit J [Coxiella-like endosymbiont of Rhipicephalus sanguineus]